MGIRNARVRHIGEMLGEFFEEQNFTKPIAEFDICNVWRDVVGDYMAQKTTVRCKDGVLFVNSTSAVVSKQLAMSKEGLLNALNQKVGKNVVVKLVIK